MKAGISQRELARRLGLSASLISQLESGQSRPSVGTLYLIVTELGVSLDDVIRGEESGAPSDGNVEVASNGSPVLRPAQRTAIDLDSGVRWEDSRPTARTASTSSGDLTRSAGHRRPIAR